MDEPTIGGRIRELRRGIFTQHDLAAAADVSVHTTMRMVEELRAASVSQKLTTAEDVRRGLRDTSREEAVRKPATPGSARRTPSSGAR